MNARNEPIITAKGLKKTFGIVFRRDGDICDEPLCTDGDRVISVSGIRSEMVIDCM